MPKVKKKVKPQRDPNSVLPSKMSPITKAIEEILAEIPQETVDTGYGIQVEEFENYGTPDQKQAYRLKEVCNKPLSDSGCEYARSGYDEREYVFRSKSNNASGFHVPYTKYQSTRGGKVTETRGQIFIVSEGFLPAVSLIVPCKILIKLVDILEDKLANPTYILELKHVLNDPFAGLSWLCAQTEIDYLLNN